MSETRFLRRHASAIGRAAAGVLLTCMLAGAAAADDAVLALTLDEAQELALEHNREMTIARGGEDAARARLT
jgi:translation initiation factor 2 gamma subunit (eIF-2gamma)